MLTRTEDLPSSLRHAWFADATPLAPEAAQALLRAAGPESLFEALCAALAETHAARAFLWLKESTRPETFVGGSLADGTAWRPEPGDRPCWDACRRALATGRPLDALDGAPAGPAYRSLLAAPLATDGAAFGVLYLEGDLPGGRLTGADHARALALAPLVAAAVELGRLREGRERQALELTEALAKYRVAAREAGTDQLTGLVNRRSFLTHAERQTAIALRYGAPYAVLLIDVDNFKTCNDVYGHAAGDRVLKGVAEVLVRSIRQPDLAARYGGEEFVILCPNTDARKAALLAERVRRAIAAAVPQADAEVPDLPPGVTASLGVATYRPGDDHVAAVIDRADRALYRAKRAGRDQVMLAEADDA